MLINHQGELYRIMAVMHVTPGNRRGMMQTKMRNLRSGLQTENRFRSDDKVERVTLEQHEMEFLYAVGRPVPLHEHRDVRAGHARRRDVSAMRRSYLTANLRVQIEFHERHPGRRHAAQDGRPDRHRDRARDARARP